LAYYFGLAFASTILSSPELIVYLVIFYKQEWTCIILCSIEINLNQPLASFDIQFNIHNVKFQIRMKRAARKSLIRQFGEVEYEHILKSSKNTRSYWMTNKPLP
jgi:hypothetical protein